MLALQIECVRPRLTLVDYIFSHPVPLHTADFRSIDYTGVKLFCRAGTLDTAPTKIAVWVLNSDFDINPQHRDRFPLLAVDRLTERLFALLVRPFGVLVRFFAVLARLFAVLVRP